MRAHLLGSGSVLRGHKVGLTSQVMQRQLGVDQPDFGFLLDEMIVESDRCVPADRFITPRVEPEVAFILQEDRAGPGLTIEDAAAAVGRIRRTGPGYPSRSAHYRCRCRRSHRHARRRRHRHRLRRHLGCSAHRERRKTRRVREQALTKARLTTLLLPGIGTIDELKLVHSLGVRSVRVATHATEADVSAQHISAARELGMDVSGFLMMSHRASQTHLAEQAKLMEAYGVHCVYITDSGGRLTMNDIRARMRAYREVLDPATEIGIHAHQNLSLSVAANSGVAVEEGAARVDASLAGQGVRSGQHPHRSVHRPRRPDRMEAHR